MKLLWMTLSAFLIVTPVDSYENWEFNDDLVGEMTSSIDESPFLTTVLSPEGPLIFPNRRQLAKGPRNIESSSSERSLTLQRFFGEFLLRDYRRVKRQSDSEDGDTRIENQKHSFKAMIVSDSNWNLLYDNMRTTQVKLVELEQERERQRQERTTTSRPDYRTRKYRHSRQRKSESDHAHIPRLFKVEYPIEAIIEVLQQCENEASLDTTAVTDFTNFHTTKGNFTGFSLYRVTCSPMMDDTFVTIGLQRVIYETTDEDGDDSQEKMKSQADAVLRRRVYDDFYYPYIAKLSSHRTIAPISQRPKHFSTERTPPPPPPPPPTRPPVTQERTTTETEGENEYENDSYDEVSPEDDASAGSASSQAKTYGEQSLPDSAILTNRIPKPENKKRKRNNDDYGDRRGNQDRRFRRSRKTANDRRSNLGGMDNDLKILEGKLQEYEEQTAFVGNCRLEAHDVVIVMDESGSIGDSDFQIAKLFVVNLTQMLRIGPGDYNSRVGLVKFSGSAHVSFHLNTYLSNDEVSNAVMSLPYGGGMTNIASGMNVAIDEVFSSSAGDRAWIPNLMIVMTDGQDDSNVARAHARAANKKINTTAIGIGSGVNSDQLARVTGNTNAVFSVNDFASLLDKNFMKALCTQLGAELQEVHGFSWVEPKEVQGFDELPADSMEVEGDSFGMGK